MSLVVNGNIIKIKLIVLIAKLYKIFTYVHSKFGFLNNKHYKTDYINIAAVFSIKSFVK